MRRLRSLSTPGASSRPNASIQRATVTCPCPYACVQAADGPDEPARGSRVLPGRCQLAVAGALDSPALARGRTHLSVALDAEQRTPGHSRLSHPLLVAGDGDGGARRPEDREDAEHARHGAALGFRSPNWRLRLPAAMATSLACVASLASLAMAAAASAVPRCLGGPAAERATFLHTRRSKSACDSSCTRSWASRSTTRRTRRPRRPRRHGLTSKRGPITREARLPRRGLVRRGLVRRYRPDHDREAWCRDA